MGHPSCMGENKFIELAASGQIGMYHHADNITIFLTDAEMFS